MYRLQNIRFTFYYQKKKINPKFFLYTVSVF